jgi:hypothetical protein
MNKSQKSKEKITIAKCSNPNCKTAFALREKCSSCYNIYCRNCLSSCEKCTNLICKFCCKTLYEEFIDIYVCPNCE